jgi:hypothetical protein
MARTLSVNSGSGESLKSSTRCGLRPKARQIFDSAVCDIPCRRRHRTRRPVRGVRRRLLQRLDDHSLVVVVTDRARLARPRLVVQPVETPLDEPVPPLANGLPVQPQTRRDLGVVAALCAGQHDPAPRRQRLCARVTTRPALDVSRSSPLNCTARTVRP